MRVCSECEKLLDAFLDGMYELSLGMYARLADALCCNTTQTHCANVIQR
jgi:hypothetical protein